MSTIREIAEKILDPITVLFDERREWHDYREEIVDKIEKTMMTAFNPEWQHRDPHFYDPEQLRAGIRVEKEHTPHPEIAAQIAMDHIDEFFDYYEYLELMEKLMKIGIPIEDTRRAIFREFGRVL